MLVTEFIEAIVKNSRYVMMVALYSGADGGNSINLLYELIMMLPQVACVGVECDSYCW